MVTLQGTVKVVRRQPVIDAEKMNESKFNTPRIEELGCGRSASHAEGQKRYMHNLTDSQTKWDNKNM